MTLNGKNNIYQNIATLQSQVYKGNLKNTVNATERYFYIFMIVQHILDYKAEIYNLQLCE